MIWYWIFRHQHTIVTHGSRLDLLAYYCMRLIDIWSIPEMGAAAILARFARHRSPGQVPNATTPPPHIQDHIHSHARSEISLCWMYSEITFILMREAKYRYSGCIAKSHSFSCEKRNIAVLDV